ncbi:glycoside hydrolase family 16 protein [Salinimicrobium gaetbulicola]|uniref:Family 16 glycosylhydrolase n=1 Tax=Salinimicrobium gaetbulicola TaxID=999702 RepID=A0ABW3IH10_9FLAO
MKSRSTVIFLVLVLLTSGISYSQEYQAAKSTDTLFFDDFSGSSLDREKWNVVGPNFWVNNEQQVYVDSAATIFNVINEDAKGVENALVLKALYSPDFITYKGKDFNFISGRINTKNKVMFTYGTAAARMKLPEGSGFWPAFWALGVGKWPDTGEIDIMEYVGETDWIGVALHGPGYFRETPLVNKYFFPEGKDATDWHVYSVDWTRI